MKILAFFVRLARAPFAPFGADAPRENYVNGETRASFNYARYLR